MNDEKNIIIASLYKEMFVRLCIYAENALHNQHLAEEAVQEAFRIANSKYNDLCQSPNPPGWIMNTLKNVIRRTQHENAQLSKLINYALTVEDINITYMDNEKNLTLYHGLIKEDDFRLLTLVAVEQYSMLEAATVFGISVEACKKRVQRAKAELKKKLDRFEK